MSVRLKLTLSYAGFLMVAGVLLLATVWVFLLRYVPARIDAVSSESSPGSPSTFVPSRVDLLNAFAPKAAWALAFLLVFGLVGGWLLAGSMLAPLRRITGVARQAGAGSLSQRVQMEGRNDEFRELADTFDTMLARLEAHVAEQQRFAANASHELRTPLAITQALLQVAREDPTRDADELVKRLIHVNSRAIDLTEALLLLSRAEQGVMSREPVDLSLLAEDAVETLLPLAEDRGIAIENSGEVATTSGSRTLLQQVTTNLVHNAIVHNVPASGRDEAGSVWITTSPRADWAALTVENTGDVLTPEHVATLVEPFNRGAARVRTEHTGVGLGLAIVDTIVDAHGGRLELTPRRGGGLSATVLLPLLTPSSGTAEV
ncbi:MAG TPA: HAMP domain-containing sensor histidine kinase [Microthrixaceae bacterium]|nr:HAMP domain-containing sensor histidine kinase [Microthrixaceae bacterium]